MLARSAVVVSVVLCLATIARAAPEDDARVHFNRAQKLFEQSHYDTALDEYQRAYDLSRYPAILYRVALCQDLLGRRADALATYRAFLVVDPKSERRAIVEARITALGQPDAKSPVEAPPAEAPPVAAPPVAAKPLPPVTPPSAAASADQPVNVLTAPPPPKPRRKALYIGLAVGGAVVVGALAVGLGVGLSHGSTPSPTSATFPTIKATP